MASGTRNNPPRPAARLNRTQAEVQLRMKLSEIPGYSADDWQRDRVAEAAGSVLACPNCARTECFHPVGISPIDGSKRKYRACKVCGFCQEADGTQADRCRMTVHTCLGEMTENQRCEFCGSWGPTNWHGGCWRMVAAEQLGTLSCQNCNVILTPYHVIPWPVQAE